MENSLPSPAAMREALDASGYLFEQEVASLIETLGFHVETNSAFLDKELEKSRELDARAVKVLYTDDVHKFQVIVELLVECKDNSSPFVFVARNKNLRELEHASPIEFVFPKREYEKRLSPTSTTFVPAFLHLGLTAAHYYYREAEKTTQFVKVVRKGREWVANHDGVYDSLLLPMAKAFESRRQEASKHNSGTGWRTVWLFFPIVVLRHGLFVLKSGVTDALPEARQRLSFVRELRSEVVNGHYLTDFVCFENLEHFMTTDVLGFANAVVELGKQKPKVLRGDES
jgi:hypothetical protein